MAANAQAYNGYSKPLGPNFPGGKDPVGENGPAFSSSDPNAGQSSLASFAGKNLGTAGNYTWNPYDLAGGQAQITYNNPVFQPNYYTSGAGAAPDNLKLSDPNLYSRPDYTGMSKSAIGGLAFNAADSKIWQSNPSASAKPTANKMVAMTLPSAPGGTPAQKAAPLPTNYSWANKGYTPPKATQTGVSVTPQIAGAAETAGGTAAPTPLGSMPPGTSGSASLNPGSTSNSPSASESFAAGGAVGDTPGAQPKGNLNAAYQTAQAALNYGRKKMGLLPGGNAPQQGQRQPSFDDGGVIPSPSSMPAGAAPPQPSPSDQSNSPPGGAQGPPQGQGQKMGYVMGSGAVPPDQLDALTKQVDPQGTMDPAERTLRAIATGQNPDQSFGIIQGMRQKFNRYQAFAKTAAQGIQGKPADLGAAAHAANQAYENVPDGTNVQFAPAKGGVAVRVSRVAGGSAQPNQQGGQQGLADGGPVGTLGPNSQSNDNSEGAWTGSSVQQPQKGVLPVASDKFDPRAFLKSQKGYADGGDVTDDEPVDNDTDAAATTPPAAGGNPPLPTPAPMQQDAGPPTSDEVSTAPSQGVIPSSTSPPQPPQLNDQVDQDEMNSSPLSPGNISSAAGSFLRFLTVPQFMQHLSTPAGSFDNHADMGADKVLASEGTPGDQSLTQFIDQFNAKNKTNYSVGSVSTGAKLPPGKAGSGAPAPAQGSSQSPAAAQPATPNLVEQGPGMPVYDRSKAGNPINRGGDIPPQLQSRAAQLFPKASQQDQRNDYIAKSMAATQAQAAEIEKAKSTRLYGDKVMGDSRQNVATTAAGAKVQSAQTYADAKKYDALMKASVAKDPSTAAKWGVIHGAIASANAAGTPMTDDQVQALMGRIGVSAAPAQAAPAAAGGQAAPSGDTSGASQTPQIFPGGPFAGKPVIKVNGKWQLVS